MNESKWLRETSFEQLPGYDCRFGLARAEELGIPYQNYCQIPQNQLQVYIHVYEPVYFDVGVF